MLAHHWVLGNVNRLSLLNIFLNPKTHQCQYVTFECVTVGVCPSKFVQFVVAWLVVGNRFSRILLPTHRCSICCGQHVKLSVTTSPCSSSLVGSLNRPLICPLIWCCHFYFPFPCDFVFSIFRAQYSLLILPFKLKSWFRSRYSCLFSP